jgi:hypothetical protein
MANNIILTPSTFVKGTLMNLGGYLSVCRNMSSQYSKYFAKEGAKVGDYIDQKKPQRFQTTSGLLYQPQDLNQTKVRITADQVTGVHFEWDGVEKTLSIDDAQENFFKPAAIALAHDINAKAAQFCAQNAFNAVGTPGTTPSTIDTYLGAGDKIVQLGLPPEEDLHCIVNRKFSSSYVIGNKSVFNPAGQISEMVKKGEMVDNTLGYHFHRDQTIYSQTVGPFGGTPLINGANQTAEGGNNATMSLITDGWTAAAAARLVVGDRFTIAGVYSVHPQTRASTGDLQQFVVLAAASSDGSGNLTATIAPAITPSGQQQNVDSAPADNAALTMFGAANTVSPQGLLMHKNFAAFVSVPLATPKEGVIASAQHTDPDTGITLAMVRFFDGVNRVEGTRFDMLSGFAVLYRELGCVIAG